MMDYTDRHARYFLRLIAKDVRLYTEMITAQAIHHGDVKRLLAYHESEHPIALQLGGSDPEKLKNAARLGEDYGYDEINLNVGCPSDRVRSGEFGACLMLQPNLVAECVQAMSLQLNVPVTVKCRIGVDNQDSYEALSNFIRTVASADCKTFIIHARKAWLKGLSPKQNREIPPLNYEVVRQIKKDFPALSIVINGGITTVDEVLTHLNFVDGVMLGRAAYHHPYLLSDLQNKCFENKKCRTRDEVIYDFLTYVDSQLMLGTKLTNMTRHILGLFRGEYGASFWRRYLCENASRINAGSNIIKEALTELKKYEVKVC